MIKTTGNDTMIGVLRDFQRRLTFLERQPGHPMPAALMVARTTDLAAQVAELAARVTELESRTQ